MNASEKRGCLETVLQALGLGTKPAKPESLPYRLTDKFLSPAELNFYRVLRTAVGDWAVICPKVSLNDLFYAKSGDRKTNVAYRNRIARKHVDFLLCDPQSMRPLLGIELDDASHRRADRQERDRFVERVFSAAGLPLQSPSAGLLQRCGGFRHVETGGRRERAARDFVSRPLETIL